MRQVLAWSLIAAGLSMIAATGSIGSSMLVDPSASNANAIAEKSFENDPDWFFCDEDATGEEGYLMIRKGTNFCIQIRTGR